MRLSRSRRGSTLINGSPPTRFDYDRPPGRPQRHRDRRRQALARPDPRRPLRLLLPARQQDVRHAHADGPVVRLPAGLSRPVPALHARQPDRLVRTDHRRRSRTASRVRRDGRYWAGRLPTSAYGSASCPTACWSPPRRKFGTPEKISLTFSGSISETVTFRAADRTNY